MTARLQSGSRAGRPYWRILTDLALVLSVISAILVLMRREPPRKPVVMVAEVDKAVAPIAIPPAALDEETKPRADPVPVPPAAPRMLEPDPAKIAEAQARLDEATAERQRAEARRQAETEALKAAAIEAARVAFSAKTLAERVRDPRARLASATARSASLRSDAERLKTELASLARAPRPRRQVLSDRTPVARPVNGHEYHFEVRGDRVAFIDLDRLVKKMEADAKLQIRLSMGSDRTIRSTVGPVGAYSLRYVLQAVMPGSLDGLLGTVSYDLVGWEIVPERETRGETWNALPHPASEFAQTLNTLNPARSTITLWVYPDGFPLYRKLLGLLHDRGFEVAARPLPAGIPIRGSPNGSVSAGQ